MQVFEKVGDEIILVYNPREKEEVEVGENLEIIDKTRGRGVIVQVIEQNLVDLPGILEDLVRRESLTHVMVREHAPPATERYIMDVKNMKFARAKIRKEVHVQKGEEKIVEWTGWVPDRSAAVTPLPDNWLTEALSIGGLYPIQLGMTAYTKVDFTTSAYDFQGITLIVGKKGTGKSHLAKAMLLGIIDAGAKCIVFDINDEYSGMKYLADEATRSPYHDKILTLEPEIRIPSKYTQLKFTLPYVGLDVFYDVLTTTLGLPDASAYTVRNIWLFLESQNKLSLSNLKDYAEKEDARVREAIIRRLDTINATQVFTTIATEETRIEDMLAQFEGGGALIINLKAKSAVTRDIVVQTILSKLQRLLEDPKTKPLFMFAEEAHMYIRQASWDDIVTRMRHLGTYQVYMTNTPTSLPELVIRQTDNLYVFNLTNERDINHIMPAAKIDPETVTAIAKALPPRRYLAIGQTTSDYPFIINTTSLQVATAGKTKLLFEKKYER